MPNLIKEMLKPDKIKPALPLLAFILFSFYFSSILAQNGIELTPDKITRFPEELIKYNNLTLTITPELIFNQNDNVNGTITIQFKLNWSETPKNERLFVINDKVSFFAFIDAPKSQWSVNKKLKEQVEQTFTFSPDAVVIYIPDNSPKCWTDRMDQFSIGLEAYPTVPIKMTVHFFLGTQTKLKGYDIDEKARELSWEFSLPPRLSKDCKQKYTDYKKELEKLDPEKNREHFDEFKEKDDQTKEEFNKIKDKNDQLQQLFKNIKTDIREMGCEDLKSFEEDYGDYLITENSLDLVGNSLKQVQKAEKEQEEVVTKQSTSLEENFNDIQVLYRDLVKLKLELIETRADFEVILTGKRDNLDQISQSGNSAYDGLAASQQATGDIKLMKKGFDRFCSASESLLDSLDVLQKQIKKAEVDDQLASGKKKGSRWTTSLWYIIPSLIIIILAIVLVKYWGSIQKALSFKKKVNS